MNEVEAPVLVPVPAKLLSAAGKALYGDRWQVPLARLLKEPSPRRMQRWAARAEEDRPYLVSEATLALLLGHLERKVFTVQGAFEQVKRFYDER